jgi:nucleotide-binding universal stress UspA family protein
MYKHIIVPLTEAALGRCLIPHVKDLAKSEGATVELLRVIEPLDIPTRGGLAISNDDISQLESIEKKEAQSHLDLLADDLTKAGIPVKTTIIVHKDGPVAIADYIHKGNYDLIVLASQKSSMLTRWIWGNVGERILRYTNTHVLLVRGPVCTI